MDLTDRISKLSPQQRKRFELKLKQQGIDISKLQETAKTRTVKKQEIHAAEKKEFYPLASAQKRLFMIHHLYDENLVYNMPGLMLLQGEVNRSLFAQTLKAIIHRHESLRTSFETIRGEPVHQVHDEVEFEIEYDQSLPDENQPHLSNQVRGEVSSTIGINRIIQDFIRPFDLSCVPLLRLGLIKLPYTLSAPGSHPSKQGKENQYLFLVDMHHIISDGLSLNLFIKEFTTLYAGEKLPPLPFQYRDFVQWQDKALMSGQLAKQEAYWLEQFPGQLPSLDMPLDFERPPAQSFEGKTIHFTLQGELNQALQALIKESSTTLFMMLLAVYNCLFYKYTGQEDIIIGTAVAGRNHNGLEKIIGLFMETLVFRCFPQSQLTFAHFLEQVKTTCLNAFENQSYPFRELMKKTVDESDLSHNPLFDAMLILHNLERLELEIEGLRFSPYESDAYPAPVQVDINLLASEDETGILFDLSYASALFKRKTMERFSRHFVNLVRQVTGNPQIQLKEIDILSPEEKQQILEQFSSTAFEYKYKHDSKQTLPELLEMPVEKIPDHTAMVLESKNSRLNWTITHRHFYQRVRHLARRLKQRGVKPDDIVGIIADPSEDMIVAVMGILNAGAAFLPIDPKMPFARVNYMLRDSSASLLLVSNRTYLSGGDEIPGQNAQQQQCQVMEINDPGVREENNSGEIGKKKIHPGNQSLADSLVYVIYTSGSTGQPKGVPISQKNLLPLLTWFMSYFQLDESSRVLQNLSYSFDFGVFEILTTFSCGGTYFIPGRSDQGDLSAYGDFIHRHCIDTLHTTPTLFKHLVSTGTGSLDLRILHFGGEALNGKLVRDTARLVSRTAVIYNGYGPTEATINTSIFSIKAEDTQELRDSQRIPIGKPSALNIIYILDIFTSSHIQPIGVAGELCIGGQGLSRGYLNNPELTSNKFCLRRPGGPLFINILKKLTKTTSIWDDITKERHLTDREWVGGATPLFEKTVNPGPPSKNFSLDVSGKNYMQSCIHASIPPLLHSPIYQTGDLARWLADGNIEFLGRIDTQVKVRGYRIELGEIENRLSFHKNIERAIVILKSGAICAYFTQRKQEPIAVRELRDFLAEKLPDYMVPAYFIPLDQVPVTSSGKVNLRDLPEPGEHMLETGISHVEPRDEIETQVLTVWQEVLHLENIGVTDDFFELGGDSITANQVIARLREEHQVELSIKKFFESPFIEALAKEIKGKERETGSIIPVPRQDNIPLSFSQERLWFLHQLDNNIISYHVPRTVRIRGKLDVSLLEKTFNEIIRRHEILRTVFPTIDEQPVQQINPPFEIKIPIIDLSSLSLEGQSARVSEITLTESQEPFDLEHGPLLRLILLTLKPEEYLLLSTEHHFIHDGWTQGILLKEFIAIYSAFSEGKSSPLLELPIQYADFALWQRNLMQGEVLESHLAYWRKKLADAPPVMQLPLDHPRPAVISGKGAARTLYLSESLSNTWKTFSKEKKVTLFICMLTAFKILLYRYTGQEDLCVGTGIANRRYKEIETLIGMVINTLPLRTCLQGNLSFQQCMQLVKTTCIEAYEHEDTPFEKIVEALRPERTLSHTPLFQVIFSFMDTPTEYFQLPGLQVNAEPTHNRSSKFDLNIVVLPPPEELAEEIGSQIYIEWEYNTDIFAPATMDRMINHYTRLLELLPTHLEEPICSLPILENSELRQLLYVWNDTAADYPKDKTIHELFEIQVEQTPDHIALLGFHKTHKKHEKKYNKSHMSDMSHLTYKELNQKTEQLAQVLRGKGIMADSITGIMVEPSIEMIIGILAILKAGGAFLPIDPDYPEERRQYMLNDSNATILLTHHDIEPSPSTLTSTCQVSSANLAYIIYTSGTTGKPKGVMIQHQSLVNLCSWHNRYFKVKESDHATQYARISFDASVWEIFPYLIKGASLHIINPEIQLDIEKLNQYFETHDITIAFLPTPLCEQFMELENHSLQKLLTGGDRLRAFIKRDYQLYNNYGPTENTVVNTSFPVNRQYINIPIGRPVDNNQIYILDKNSHLLQPIGIPGELCIGGDGLARGYLNNPDLTAEKFDHNFQDYHDGYHRSNRSHTSYITHKSNILYRTGDLARWIADGNIEFLGRIDTQVKIRGFRIELEEIENQLLEHENIKEALVIDLETNPSSNHHISEKQLCAYIVPYSPGVVELPLDCREIKEYLEKKLPHYMIPSYIVTLDKIPLTPNGKVNLKALSQPGPLLSEKKYVKPQGEIEEKLENIWKEILGIKKIGANDNFFTIGGHSLRAALLKNHIRKKFNVDIALTMVFSAPTIRGLAHMIEKAKKSIYEDILPIEKKEYYPLSAAQKRLFFLDRFEQIGTSYNISTTVKLKGKLDIETFEKALKKLVRSHETLRTSFEFINETPVQRIHQEMNFQIQVIQQENKEIQPVMEEFIKPFDLTCPPLLRAAILKLSKTEYILLLDMHHIISDGTSMGVVIENLTRIYSGNPPEPLKIQYKNFSLWQNKLYETGQLKYQMDYWLSRFTGEIPVLELPGDYPRPPILNFAGRHHHFYLENGETEKLKAINKEMGVTLYMNLLAVLNILLFQYTGQQDIIVGSGIMGRPHADLQKVIGMFVNFLAMRNNPHPGKTYREFLIEVKKNTLEAFENQDVQFEELVRQLNLERNPSRNPLFDVTFVVQNFESPFIRLPGLEILPYERENKTSKFDLTLFAYEDETNNRLAFYFEYAVQLFKPETIQTISRHFKEIINQVTKNNHIALKDISLSEHFLVPQAREIKDEQGDFEF